VSGKTVNYELLYALLNDVKERLRLSEDEHEWLTRRVTEFYKASVDAVLVEYETEVNNGYR
jgi:hypothetical protein